MIATADTHRGAIDAIDRCVNSAAWSGPETTQHMRIRIGAGVCGAAAATRATEIVDDVTADRRYIACFPSTRSEIAVPIFALRRVSAGASPVVGEIDVDSDVPSAFNDGDQRFLEQVARMVSARL